MKNTTFALSALVLTGAMVSSMFAAPGDLTTEWQIDAGSVAWFANDHSTRDLAYNPATDHVLVVSRTGGLNIQILDAATGLPASPSTMDITGISGGTYPLNHIEVADDGVIYGMNLVAFSFASSPFRFYRWADEGSTPTIARTSTAETVARVGDSFAVTGSATGTVLYASGSGNATVEVYTTADGVTFTKGAGIPVGLNVARLGLDVLSGGNLFANSVGTGDLNGDVGEFTLGGSLVGQTVTTEVAAAYGALGVSLFGGSTYLALQGGDVNNVGGAVVDISSGLPSASVLSVAPASISLGNANTNGVGAAVFDTTRQFVILCNTNNSIGSYSSPSGGTVPVELGVLGVE